MLQWMQYDIFLRTIKDSKVKCDAFLCRGKREKPLTPSAGGGYFLQCNQMHFTRKKQVYAINFNITKEWRGIY